MDQSLHFHSLPRKPDVLSHAAQRIVVIPSLALAVLTLYILLCSLPRPLTTLSAFIQPTSLSPNTHVSYPVLAAQGRGTGGSAFRRRDYSTQPPRPPPRDDDGWSDGDEGLGDPLPPSTRPDLKTLTDPAIDSRVVAAVDRLGGRVTVADVAASAGVDLATAGGAVRDMAYLTGAGILVTNQGDLLYDFGPGVRARLAGSSLRAAATQAYQKAAPVLQKLVRVTFGLALFASLAIIFTSLTMLQTSSRSDRDERDNRSSGMMFGPQMFYGPNIWIIPDPFYGYGPSNAAPAQRQEMTFIESVYSFVFGDGDPNYNLEERRWRQVAQVIRANKGAVVAEQLAPYLDPPAGWSARSPQSGEPVDEGFMTPALVRFNGRPEVTPEGDIVYVFDELRPTTSRQAAPSQPSSTALLEREVQFSRASGLNLFLAGALGALNLFGALQLGTLFGSISAARTLGPFLDGVRVAYPFLLVYALVFVSAPIFRWIKLKATNPKIQERNERRMMAAAELSSPPRSVLKKVTEAKRYQGEQRITSQDILYRSDRDTPPPAADPFAEFDQRLGNKR